MRIVPYDELDDPTGLIKLLEPAFGWAPTPAGIRRWRRLDVRYRERFGFAAVADQEAVGFLGVMDIPVRTIDRGVEMVGGIFGVATDPNRRREGIATRLFRHAHTHFRRKGYRFSFLCTAHSLVGYNLYAKLGYTDTPVENVPRAYRILGRPAKKARLVRHRLDSLHIQRLFSQATADRTGLCVRVPDWPRVLISTRELKPETILSHRDGYAFLDVHPRSVFISELVARDRATYARMLDRIERLGKPVIIGAYVYDDVLEELYRDRGYVFRRGKHFTVMCRPLAGHSFERAFGDRFYSTALDTF